MNRSENKTLICDSCGKEVEKALMTLRLKDKPDVKLSLGKYYEAKPNTDLVITWGICYECFLNALLSSTSKFKSTAGAMK